MEKIQHVLWYFHTKRFNLYLSIAILTWITKPYSFEEYQTERPRTFRNWQYMKTKVKNFVSNLLKELWQKPGLTLEWGINSL